VTPGWRRALCGACLIAAVPAAAATWREDFAGGSLDASRWERTHDGDFDTWSADVVSSSAGYRLRLQADTTGTRDDTVKHLGIASRCALPVESGARVQVRLDWGPPANGSYLAAALVVSPHATAGDPQATDDWLSVGYAGVPPGRNARLLVVARSKGVTRTLYADGWPERNREGRRIGQVEIEVAWRGSALEIREDGRLVLVTAASEAPFETARVYLQLASHSNYRSRQVHFEDVRWTVGGDAPVLKLPSAPACAT